MRAERAATSDAPRGATGHAPLAGERGSAVLELAVFLVFLGPLCLFGTSEMATVTYGSIEVANAAHAGAMYAMQNTTTAANTSSIQAAARAEAADFGANLSVASTLYWACATDQSGTTYTTQSAATSACAGSGNHALPFVRVTTSATVTPPFHVPALLASYVVSGTSVMEVLQ
jgi:Flp pilus assembly protein TadG